MNTTREHSFFPSHSYVLVCSYSEAEYAQQKAALEENFSFQAEAMATGWHGEDEVPCQPEATVDGVLFRCLSVYSEDYPRLAYPWHMMLIGTDDANREIIYIYFMDTDADELPPIEDFILKSCGWKYIR